MVVSGGGFMDGRVEENELRVRVALHDGLDAENEE